LASILSLQSFLVTRAKFFNKSFGGLNFLNKAFYISTLFMIVSYHFFKDTYLHKEDGVFESLTTVLALMSSLMLLVWSWDLFFSLREVIGRQKYHKFEKRERSGRDA